MEGKAGYAADERSVQMAQIEELKRALERKQGAGNLAARPMNEVGPPDHLSIQGVINLLGNDTRQLHEQLIELRQRLAPLLSERDTRAEHGPSLPINCKMAAELYDIHTVVQNSRQLVEITMLQLDI